MRGGGDGQEAGVVVEQRGGSPAMAPPLLRSPWIRSWRASIWSQAPPEFNYGGGGCTAAAPQDDQSRGLLPRASPLNKTDLVDDAELEVLTNKIKLINGMAEMKKVKFGDIDMDFVLRIGGYDLDRRIYFFSGPRLLGPRLQSTASSSKHNRQTVQQLKYKFSLILYICCSRTASEPGGEGSPLSLWWWNWRWLVISWLLVTHHQALLALPVACHHERLHSSSFA